MGARPSKIEVVTFNKKYLPAFVEFNREWIEKHFAIEAMDIAQLESPYARILEPGGEIFFVLEEGHPAATCAMVPHGPGCFEIAKMAVTPRARGRGYGDLMMKTAIRWAIAKHASRIVLLSNTVLAPAISLYQKHGFQTTRLGPHPDYERCNIEMVLEIGMSQKGMSDF